MFEKFTERARKVMSLARQEAQRLNGGFIETEHVRAGVLGGRSACGGAYFLRPKPLPVSG